MAADALGIRSHGTDKVLSEYSGFITRRVNSTCLFSYPAAFMGIDFTSTSHDHHQEPLLLTWMNFIPSMDK